MNENETTSVETFVDEDWGEISFADNEEEIENKPEETEAAEEEADAEAESEADQQSEGEEAQTESDAEIEEELFVLKHLGTERSVNRDEVISLAQQGMDYSRIKDKLHNTEAEKAEIADKLSYFEKLASSQGKSLDEFIEATAAALRADEKKISYDEALREVHFEFEKTKFAKEKSDWEKSRNDTKSAEDARQADIDAFAKKFPEAAAEPKSIPKEVWDEVNSGVPLTEAYGNYLQKQKDAEIASLRKQLEREKQHKKNKESSTGSQATDNSSADDEAFNALWVD